MSAKEFNIIHFNDVYEIAQRTKEPVGGAARFATTVKGFAELNPMVLFSGDVFNPSVMSTTTKGKHMIPVLNNLKVQCSVVGNHEFDFGPQVLAKNLKGCNFPWLFSNVVDKETGEQLLGTLRHHIILWNGVKVGLVGLVEVEWVNTTHDIDKFSKYLDFVEEGTKISAELRSLGAEIVICLAHMRMRNCVKLADSVPGVDLILAGHDHFYEINTDKKIVVSGTDFRNLTLIKASKNSDKWSFDFQKVDVTSTFSEDAEMAAIIQKFSAEADVKLNKVIGHTNNLLDATNASVRTSETNIGNLFADIMKQEMKTDFAFINAGSIRSDGTYGPGDFTLKNLLTVLPYVNYVVTIKISGAKVKQLLEASVSSYPAQDGRFAQVSGIQFEFDPQQPAGNRVLWIKINGVPVDTQKLYIAASEGYIAKGNDGYDCLREGCEFVVDDDNAPILSTLVRKHFIVLRVLDAMDGLRKTDVEKALAKWSKKKTFSVQPQIEGRIIIKGITKN